jgi:spore coat protein F
MENHQHLAWHESLELHELVAFKSIGLMRMKKTLPELSDSALKGIYERGIKENTEDLQELMGFYQIVPKADDVREDIRQLSLLFEGELLAFTKAGVRNYAVAITETATPKLKEVLTKQMLKCIELHDLIYRYMYSKGHYPSYDLNKLFENDLKLANQAISM